MRCENKNESMKFNRFLSKPQIVIGIIIIIDVILFLCFNYIINVISDLNLWINDKEHPEKYMGLNQVLPQISHYGKGVYYVYIFFAIGIIAFDLIFAYQIRVAFSEKDINKGQKGRSRFTTIPEIKKQCKAIPLSKEMYVGKAGAIMTSIKDKIYINTYPINRIYIGSTRSGKDQSYVLSLLDVISRPIEIDNRVSVVVNDPKLEAYKSSKKTLEKRGYIVRLLNLDDPTKSMGYNLIQISIDHYKNGDIPKAQMAARTFSFSVFHAENDNQEPIWKNTATDLFTALIVAVMSDCLEADIELNKERLEAFRLKQEAFFNLEEDKQAEARTLYTNIKKNVDENEDIFSSEDILYIPPEAEFYEINPNEKKVNCFSVINFFKELCDRVSKESSGEDEFEKKAATALDDYFNSRPKLDFASSLYSNAKTAGARTKGSIYTNMQSTLSVFSLYTIAQMTAESDFDIADLGYGDKPVAIFLGTPFEDRSNHFIVSTFIAQSCQYLAQLAKKTNGKLKREVKYVINEAGSLPQIENLDTYVTGLLGVGISFDFYVQSYQQIRERYKDKAKTILENCANHVYIMNVGNESAEEFSKMLGTKTILSSDRTGKRFSFDKTYMERPEEVPLMFPDELGMLKEGESVIYRRLQRKDRLGVAVESTPIINEYADSLSIVDKVRITVKMLYKRLIKKETMLHPEEKYALSVAEEWKVRCNDEKRYKGTALLYAHQYLTDEFPNAYDIDFYEICDEDRSHIDFTERIYDPEEVLNKLNRESKTEGLSKDKILFKEAPKFIQIKYKLISELGKDYLIKLGISENDTIKQIKKAIMKNSSLKNERKQEVLSML